MVRVTDLFFSYGDKPLFSGVSFIIGKGQKVGLVGPNGSGKSTLLKLIIQQELPVSGEIETIGSLGYVPQEVKSDQGIEGSKSIRGYLDPSKQKPDFELKKMLHRLGLGRFSLAFLPKNLSGGEKTKLALGRALLEQPDILLLDEPTNFLDETGKKWVMEFLGDYPKTVILVSHDLILMNHAINKVLYINHQTRKIDQYKGNYSDFIRLKKEKDDLLKRQVTAEQKHIRSMQNGLKILRRYTSKKGVRARVILQRRIQRAKEKLPQLPVEIRKIKVKLPETLPVGQIPIRAINISKSFGNKQVFSELNFSIVKKERIVLIGPNGAGKSTLIKILIGHLKPDKGKIIRDDNLKIGYYSQEFESLDQEKTLLDLVIDTCHQGEGFSRPFLGRFNFLGNKVFQKIKSLSGGEKTRLVIALLTGQNSNLLILDEPTTYLDSVSQRVILDVLKEYRGTMIVVSHSQEFIAELKPNKAFLMPENKMVYWSRDLLEKISEI